MADIKLLRPQAGESVSLTPNPEDRLVFEFESGDATLSRVDDNLVMSFEDGAVLTLADFYVAYTSENMPEFLIGGEVVPGEAFFAALGEELMPAAGPAAGPQGSGNSVDTISGELFGGLDSLSGLNQSFGSRSFTGTSDDDTTDAPPIINGIVVTPDADPDAFSAGLDVIESGVGRNDNGSFSADMPNQVYNGDFIASGRIDAEDPEGLPLEYSILGTSEGIYGSIVMNASTGEFTYTFRDDATANVLAQGETHQEIFTAEVEDVAGNTATVQIVVTVTGTNDRPILSIEETDFGVTDSFNNPHLQNNGEEAASVSGFVEGFDVDNGHVLEYSVSHINPNLLDQAIYDDLASALAQVNAYKDDIDNSDLVQNVGAFLGQIEAADFTGFLEQISAALPTIKESLTDKLTEALGNAGDAADTSAVMADITSFLQGEFGKLDDLVGHPISEAIVGKFTDLMSQELGKLPVEADKLDSLVQDLVANLQEAITGSLNTLFDKFQADFDALVDQVAALEAVADAHPLSEIIANANAAIEGVLSQLQEAVDNANAQDYQENSLLPSSETVANGLYGKLVIGAESGSFTYTLYTEEEAKDLGPEFEAAFWALQMRDEGEQSLDTEHFTIYVKDEHGAWDYKNISIDVMGANDTPIIHHANDMTVQESGNGIIVGDKNLPNMTDHGLPVAVGQVVASDIDVEKLTFAVEGGSPLSGNALFDTIITNDYGSLYLNSDTGTYSFVLNNDSDATQALNEGETKVFEFTFAVTDNQNDGTAYGTESTTVKLTIEGTNDQPTLTLDKAILTVTEDGALNKPEMEQASGKATGHDVDLHPSNDEDGTTGEVLSYNIEYARPELTLVQEMANMLKVLGVNVNEEALDAVANMTEQAYEALGTNTGSATELNGLYGKLSIDPTSGEYSYELYSQAEAEALGAVHEVAYWALKYRDDNEAALNENFTVTVKDDLGAWNSESLTVEVYGSNDKPVIVAANSLTVQEAGEGIVVGNEFLPNSPDLGKPAAAGQILAVDDINDMLNNLEFNIVGGMASNGSLNLADLTGINLDALDNVDAFPYDYTISHEFGDLYLNKDTGTYIFVVDQDAADKLNEGEDVNFNFSFTVTDGDLTSEAKEITVTLEGTNDRPEFTVSEVEHNVYEFLGDTDNDPDFEGDAREQGPASVSGKAVATDADAAGEIGDTQAFSLFYALPEFSDIADIFNIDSAVADKIDGLVDITQEIYETFAKDLPKSVDAPAELNGLYGSLSLAADGSYTYTLYTWDQAVELGPVTMAAYVALQRRDEGDDALPTENFIVRVEDSQGAWDTQELSFNVMGTNDGPVIESVVAELAVQEDGVKELSEEEGGNDLGDIITSGIRTEVETVVDGLLGKFTPDSVGDYVTNAVMGIITPVIDASLAGASDATADEFHSNPNQAFDGVGSEGGKIVASDDDGSVIFTPKFDGSLPKIGLDLPDPLTNLDAYIDIFEPGSGLNVVDIIGVLGALEELQGIADGSFTLGDFNSLLGELSALQGAIDFIDTSALFELVKDSITLTTAGDYGNFTMDMAGNYSYTIDESKANVLAQGESKTEIYTIEVRDQFGNVTKQDITVTITGTNDKPEIAVEGNLSIFEDEASVAGTVSGKDVDNGAKLSFFVGNLVEVNTDEALANLVKGLQDYRDSLTGWGSGVQKGIVDDLIDTLTADDADSSAIANAVKDALATTGDFKSSVDGEYGTLKLVDADTTDTEAQYVYELNNDDPKVQALAEGETKVEKFEVYVRDEHGAWTSKEISVTITGTDDVPQVQAPADVITDDTTMGTAVEGTMVFTSAESMANGTITIDGTEFTVTENAGKFTVSPDTAASSTDGYGSIKITGLVFDEVSGKYTLTYEYTQVKPYLGHTSDDANELKESAAKFDVTIQDGQVGSATLPTHTVNVDIHDDEPVIVDADADGTTEAVVTGNVASTTLDVDFGADGYGKITIEASEGGAGTKDIIAEWNGTNWVGAEGFSSTLVEHPYKGDANSVKIGDVVLVQNGNEWTVSFEANVDRTVDIIFEDGDGDSVSHSIKASDPQPIPTDVIVPTSAGIVEDATTPYEGKLFENDDVFGADGPLAPVDGWAVDVNKEGWTKSIAADGTITLTDDSTGSTLTVKQDGTFTFKTTDIAVDTDFGFTYTLTDADGDSDSADLTISAEAVQGVVKADENTIISETIANVALVIDSSGSMTASDMNNVEAALKQLGESLDGLDVDVIRVALFDYNNNVTQVLNIESKDGNFDISTALDAIDWEKGGNGGTNTSAGLSSAEQWFDSLPKDPTTGKTAGNNFTILISDAEPTEVNNGMWMNDLVVLYEGKFYLQTKVEDVDDGNLFTVDDKRYTYTSADGSIITRFDDLGLVGVKESTWYENGTKEITNNNPAFLHSDKSVGEQWEQGDFTFRLVKSGKDEELQVYNENSGAWTSLGDVEGANPVLATKFAAASLKAMMGENGEFYGIGIDVTGWDLWEGISELFGYEKENAQEFMQDICNTFFDATDSSKLAEIFSKVFDDIETGIETNTLLTDVVAAANSVEGVDVTEANFVEDMLTLATQENGLEKLDKIGEEIETMTSGSTNVSDTTITGAGEDDVLIGFRGNDTIEGGAGHDILFGGAGNDELNGDAGDDILFGGAGNDILFGGAGNDILFGDAGDDYLIGTIGYDTLYGGDGNDLLKLEASNLTFEDVLVDGGNGMDVLLAGVKDMTELENLMKDGKVTNVEVVVFGENADTVTGSSVDEVLTNLKGISQDADKNGVKVDSNTWGEGTERTINGEQYVEYSHQQGEDLQILVAKNTLDNFNVQCRQLNILKPPLLKRWGLFFVVGA